jgi:phage N-6-adenine-methyltransferase
MVLGSTIGRATDDTKGARQCWRTPPDFFGQLHEVFGFTVDGCASADNALLPRYWTEAHDCRVQDWSSEVAFCNPPFGMSGTILPCAAKAKTAVVLLPASAITTAYVGACPPALLVVPPYRVRFLPPDGVVGNSPSLGTVVLVYGLVNTVQVEALKRFGLAVFERG